LELARADKLIGKALEAKVTLHCGDELYGFLSPLSADLKMVFIVSQVVLEQGGESAYQGAVEGLGVTVSKADGEKCERCWAYTNDVGSDSKHPTLCARCAAIVQE